LVEKHPAGLGKPPKVRGVEGHSAKKKKDEESDMGKTVPASEIKKGESPCERGKEVLLQYEGESREEADKRSRHQFHGKGKFIAC